MIESGDILGRTVGGGIAGKALLRFRRRAQRCTGIPIAVVGRNTAMRRPDGSTSAARQVAHDIERRRQPARLLPLFDELVVQPLVISFAMIVEKELANSISQRSLAEEDHPVETLGFQAQMKPLQMANSNSDFCGGKRTGSTSASFRIFGSAAEIRVTVHQHVTLVLQETIDGSVRFLAICFMNVSPSVGVQAAK